jgi:SpoVK/Ycf46/Vps4 family AAA+-type ATPase
MARADLLIGIVRAARGGDEAALQRTVEALIAEERQKQHHVLADRLEELLQQNGSRSVKDVPVPASGLSLSVPRRTLDELFLPTDVEEACREVVAEQAQVELLRSYGLEPRHRPLLTGPPGNGKTSLAEAMAEALVVPLLQVRYEAVIGSYVGETAARIAELFAYARTRRCVLFFDEFDAIAKERGDVHETGEIKRVVSSLLMQVDTLPRLSETS